jgi:hypothetical protein
MLAKRKIKTPYNSTYPKVAVQWLNQALCFYQSFCLVDSEVLRNRHLRVAAKRYRQLKKELRKTKNMQTGKSTVKSIFDGTRIFNIPIYQRAYSWEESNLNDYLTDIINQQPNRPYFYGTFLFHNNGERGDFKIIDIVETAKNIADVFDVSLDYLVGDVLKPSFDKRMIERLEDFELLSENDKSHLFALLDAFLRDAKTKKAYS